MAVVVFAVAVLQNNRGRAKRRTRRRGGGDWLCPGESSKPGKLVHAAQAVRLWLTAWISPDAAPFGKEKSAAFTKQQAGPFPAQQQEKKNTFLGSRWWCLGYCIAKDWGRTGINTPDTWKSGPESGIFCLYISKVQKTRVNSVGRTEMPDQMVDFSGEKQNKNESWPRSCWMWWAWYEGRGVTTQHALCRRATGSY